MFFFDAVTVDDARFKQLYNFVNSDIFLARSGSVKQDNFIRTERRTKREYVIFLQCCYLAAFFQPVCVCVCHASRPNLPSAVEMKMKMCGSYTTA